MAAVAITGVTADTDAATAASYFWGVALFIRRASSVPCITRMLFFDANVRAASLNAFTAT